MGDEDRGEAEALLQRAQLPPHLHAHLGVEVRERLVEQQHLRLDGERAGQRDPLLLAARELRRPALGVGGEADQLERRGDAAPISARGTRRSSRPKATFCATVMCGHSA